MKLRSIFLFGTKEDRENSAVKMCDVDVKRPRNIDPKTFRKRKKATPGACPSILPAASQLLRMCTSKISINYIN